MQAPVAEMSTGSRTTAAPLVKKGAHMVSWSQQEDDLLREQVAIHGSSDNWTIIAAQFNGKTGRQCRRRWFTYLNADCKKGGWSPEEDVLLCEAQKIFGNRWTEIAKMVSGRSDNAVKNRFSTLCKKRAKDEASCKENNGLLVSTDSKRALMKTSATKHVSYDGSANPKFSSYSLAANCGITRGQSRPPLALLTQKLNSSSILQETCHIGSRTNARSCDTIMISEDQGTFLRKDDPKLTALLQQEEMLSSLAVRVNSENTKESLENAWKELEDYETKFKELIKDNTKVNSEGQLSLRKDYAIEDSQANCGACTGSKHQFEDCSLNCEEGFSDKHKSILISDEVIDPFTTDKQYNGIEVKLAASELNSPLKTIHPFHSFTDEIPTPEFSTSEKKFLLSVLGKSSPCTFPNSSQQSYHKIYSFPSSNHSPSCKRALLNSL
ncbi:Myb-related protein 3R-1 [Apostasia shenzhenica]|uniref:Myb-related protein 3R-1 n=1 Tax=Apostasia shenzhenica TaxID=1088818 RepID=A0A2I0AB66_9ASPA|nr:Myb-related protein 3R-1 [Apostasia shenzhenica]